VKTAAAVNATRPKTLARTECEEAKFFRSMRSPSQFLT
jgi:hypothetical protein